MRSLEAFQHFYERELRSVVEPLERRRGRRLRGERVWFLTWIPVSLLGTAVAVATTGSGFLAMATLTVGCLAAIVGAMYLGRTGDLEAQVVPRIVRFLDPSFRYEAEANDMRSALAASQLLPRRSKLAKARHHVRGRIADTEFEIAEVFVDLAPGSETSGSFHGIFFAADFHKVFRCTTLVLPDGAETRFGRMGRLFQRWAPGATLPLLELEDADFERLFEVRGEDPVEARYLLSPALMKRLADFRRRSGRPVGASFVDSRLYMSIELDRGLLTTSATERLDDFEVLRACYEDLALCFGIVEDLDLNTRIWSKP